MRKKSEEELKKSDGKNSKEYYLNEQLKAIQKELGEIDEGKDEITNISKAITKAKMPKKSLKKNVFLNLKN